MFVLDPLYLVLAAPGLLLAMWAQWRVSSTFAAYRGVATRHGRTGAEIAEAILRTHGVRGVRIEPVQGTLSDHYDPTTRTLRLSEPVFFGRSVAAAGVAAHEVGHAIQHAQKYPWLGMRSNLVPVLGLTNSLAMPTLLIGFVLSSLAMGALASVVMLAGLVMFGVTVLFQLVTLPVEFDASRRALQALEKGHIAVGPELAGARAVLNAAALTYVAAAVSSLLTLLYFLLRSGLLGSNRDE
jgi:Zn-dependent membrane protease YugP